MTGDGVRHDWFTVGPEGVGGTRAAWLLETVLGVVGVRADRLDVSVRAEDGAQPPAVAAAARDALVASVSVLGRRRTTVSVTARDAAWPHARAWAPWSVHTIVYGNSDELVASLFEGTVTASLSADEADALRSAEPGIELGPVPEPPSIWASLLRRPPKRGRTTRR